MSKHKDKSEIDHFKGEIRELTKINKALRRRLKTLERNRHVYEQFKLDSDEIVPRVEYQATPTCPKCKKPIFLLDLGLKKLWTCGSCSFRKVENE